jgi:DNA-binding MarR family transcriptional regulator
MRDDQASREWDAVTFVSRSQERVTVCQRLAIGPASPSQIALTAATTSATITRTLETLQQRGLVAQCAPAAPQTERIYALTDDGTAVWRMIDTEQRNYEGETDGLGSGSCCNQSK